MQTDNRDLARMSYNPTKVLTPGDMDGVMQKLKSKLISKTNI